MRHSLDRGGRVSPVGGCVRAVGHRLLGVVGVERGGGVKLRDRVELFLTEAHDIIMVVGAILTYLLLLYILT